MTPTSQHTRVAMLNVVGLVVAAAGIMIQYVSGVDYPTIPPGPIILLAAAAVVAFGPWRWSSVVGLVAALFLSIGGAIATIVGNGSARRSATRVTSAALLARWSRLSDLR
jgi:hypothetical protein